jgi:phosphoglycerate dehydrogenase-like enzyme
MTSDVTIVGRDAALFVEKLAARFADLRIHAAADASEAIGICATSDVLLIRTDEIRAALVAAMPRLRFIQALTTGTDHIEALTNIPAHVTIVAARGFHGPQMSELAFIFMLHFTRDLRACSQRRTPTAGTVCTSGFWNIRPLPSSASARLPEELARRCQVFGMRVIGVSAGRTSAPGFETIVPRERLNEAAAAADFLIVLLPHNKDTHHLIGADVLGAMKRTGILINIARGGVVDEEALIRALRSGQSAAPASTCSRPSRCRRTARCGICRTCSSPRISAA